MIGIAGYPNVSIPFELPFGAERKSTLEALNCQFKTCLRGNQQVEVIGHQDESVDQVTIRSEPIECFEEEVCPALVAEEGLPPRRVRGHEVSLAVVGGDLPVREYMPFPRGLKPDFLYAYCGAAKAALFQNASSQFSAEARTNPSKRLIQRKERMIAGSRSLRRCSDRYSSRRRYFLRRPMSDAGPLTERWTRLPS